MSILTVNSEEEAEAEVEDREEVADREEAEDREVVVEAVEAEGQATKTVVVARDPEAVVVDQVIQNLLQFSITTWDMADNWPCTI